MSNAEWQGKYFKINAQLEFYEKEFDNKLMSIVMCAESALSAWEKDASDKALKELLDSIVYKAEFLRGMMK